MTPKRTVKLALAVLLSTLSVQNIFAQQSDYQYPSEENIQQKLDQWQDLKFGILLHWGVYSVPGICESWPICSEDVDWIPRDSNMRYEDYKQWYWNLANDFNPKKFNPEQWAKVSREAGMKYCVFTTKHHDGFCMFNTQQTDYSIANYAFRKNKQSDVARYVFEAYREQGLWTGAYFSKPDWHCQYYWWDRYATPDRHVNYDISKHPARWKQYQDFTYNQISELVHNYGNLDILWLDGGWVDKAKGEDVNMARIAAMAREAQPDMLIVDRTVHGPYENYCTPEQQIPDTQLDYPWESCITLSHAWGYAPDCTFKTPQKVIAMLAEITAKGGNMLLGVGPTPEGTFEQPVIDILKQVGKWLKHNGEAIYGTRRTPNYHDGNIWFTANKDGKTRYAIYAIGERGMVPYAITWKGNIPAKRSKMILLENGKKLKWKTDGETVTVTIPEKIDHTQPIAIKFVVDEE